MIREAAKSTKCQNNLKMCATGLFTWANDNDGYLPWSEGKRPDLEGGPQRYRS